MTRKQLEGCILFTHSFPNIDALTAYFNSIHLDGAEKVKELESQLRVKHHHIEMMMRNMKAWDKERKELLEILEECASVLRWTLDNAKPDSDWTTFTNSITNAMVASEELIKSATQIK